MLPKFCFVLFITSVLFVLPVIFFIFHIRDVLLCAQVTSVLKNVIFAFSSSALLQHITAMLECSVSAVVTLLVTEPVGMLSIRSCRVQMLSDWYTMLYNPSPDYINTLHCTQEAVYPL